MEKIIYRITLDTLRNGVQRVLQGFQTGDRYARSIDITLVSGSVSYELPLQNVIAAMYVTVNGVTSVNECAIDANKITYEIHNEDIATEGTVQMQLKLIETRPGGAERVLVSPNFALEVWQSDTDDSEAEGTQTFTALENALAKAQEYADKTIAHVIIDEDNLFVVEYRDGTLYTSTVIQDALADITNVEAFALRAEAAMVSAEEDAAIAAEAKTTAVDSKNIAVNAANSATLSEANASQSERNAADSEANALAYKSAALASQNAAKTSEDNAKTSEQNAKTSETNAKASENNAKTSEDNAKASEDNAATDAASAAENAVLSQSYAVGGTNTRPNESNDNAKYYKEVCEQVATSLQGGFIPMGTVTFANLPTNASAGWMYNVSDEFVSDSRFKDGGGKKYAAGTNVYLTSDLMWDCLSGAIPTVNGKNGNSITLDGRDIAVTGYTKAASESAISASDSINVALGKLEKKADEVGNKIGSAISGLGEVLTYKGTVATFADLPTNAQPGWVYHVASEGTNYAYEVEPGATTGTWSEMGQHIDLSDYVHYTDIANDVGFTDFEIGTTWVANTDIGNFEDYPFKQTVSNKVYTTDRECLVLGSNASAMPTKTEMDEMGKLSQFVDFTNGVTVLASEETTVSLTLRVKGV